MSEKTFKPLDVAMTADTSDTAQPTRENCKTQDDVPENLSSIMSSFQKAIESFNGEIDKTYKPEIDNNENCMRYTGDVDRTSVVSDPGDVHFDEDGIMIDKLDKYEDIGPYIKPTQDAVESIIKENPIGLQTYAVDDSKLIDITAIGVNVDDLPGSFTNTMAKCIYNKETKIDMLIMPKNRFVMEFDSKAGHVMLDVRLDKRGADSDGTAFCINYNSETNDDDVDADTYKINAWYDLKSLETLPNARRLYNTVVRALIGVLK